MFVQAAASDVLKKLVLLFGVDWAKRFVVPKVLRLARTTNYLHRMTFLMCVNRCAYYLLSPSHFFSHMPRAPWNKCYWHVTKDMG